MKYMLLIDKFYLLVYNRLCYVNTMCLKGGTRMWPNISLKKRELEDWDYRVRQLPEEDAIIKEIVMIYNDFECISYDHQDVACALEYDTEFGLHTILFSKKDHLNYEHGMDWIAVYSSNYIPGDDVGDGERCSIPIDVLTDIYKNTLKYIPKELFSYPEIPEHIEKILDSLFDSEK